MADSKITALTSIGTSTDPAVDPLVLVDVSDTSMAATGTTKKVTLNNLLSSSPTATGNFTITGDLTAARLNVTGATLPANGMYLVAANKIAFSTNSTKRFTIDDFGNLLNSTTATQNGFLQFDNSIDGGTLGYVGNAKALISGGSTSSVGIRGESSVQFAIGSNLAMTLNSTGLGIGVASPAYKLQVIGTSGTLVDFSGSGVAGMQKMLQIRSSNANSQGFSIQQNSTTEDILLNSYYGGASLIFGTNNTEKYRLASDGVATWSNVGGVAGTAMTLNSTGLGVGTATIPYKLTVASPGSSNTMALINNTSNVSRLMFAENATPSNAYTAIEGDGRSTGYFAIRTNDTERLRIDSSGNVGIGVTPSAWQSGYRAVELAGAAILGQNGSCDLYCNSYLNSSFQSIYRTTAAATNYAMGGGLHRWFIAPSGTAGNAITWTQAMTLDASGNLLVGQTASTNGGLLKGYAFNFNSGESQFFIGHQTGTASGTYYEGYSYNGTLIGSITQNGTTGVLYNITSDYRLKEQVQPLIGGLARVNALKPSVYKWKSDGSNGEGFLAHELAEVVPFAVSGEKDAVNEDGSIKSQGIDMSRVVPILVAAIQELAAEVNALKNA